MTRRLRGGCLLCVILVILLPPVHLSPHSSAVFPKALQRLVYSGDTLYVAGTDMLYKLDKNTLVAQPGRPLPALASCQATCQRPRGFTPSITCFGTFDDTRLFVCTSRYGNCLLVNMEDLTATSRSAENIVTENSNGTVVFVKAAYRTMKESIWIASSPSANSRIALSIRKPSFRPAYISQSTLDQTYKSSTLSYQSIPGLRIDDVYVFAFVNSGYRFYIKNRNCKSYLVGMCDSDENFNTLTEIPMACTSDVGEERRYIQAAYLGGAGTRLLDRFHKTPKLTSNDHILFAVFGKNVTSSQTSVCAFNVRDLLEAVKKVFIKCYVDGNDDVHIGPRELLDIEPQKCQTFQALTTNASLTVCQIVNSGLWDGRRTGYSPLVYAKITMRSSDLDVPFAVASLYVQGVGLHTVAFMVARSGSISKAVIVKENQYEVYETIDLDDTAVQPSISVGNNRIYALTSGRVYSVPVEQCQTATNCQACAALNDPFCGWCSLSSRCLTQAQCPRSTDTNGRWLQGKSSGSSERFEGCIVAKIEETSISIEQRSGSESIKLNVEMSTVPDLGPGQAYKCCLFADSCALAKKTSQTGGGLEQVTTDYLQCETPSVEDIRGRIVAGKDYVSTNLSLRVDDMEFSYLELTFYECSRHTSCTSCAMAQSTFFCSWCLHSYSCHQGDSTRACSGAVVTHALNQMGGQHRAGASNCPKMESFSASQNNVLVASGSRPSLRFRIFNTQPEVRGYTCEVSWDRVVMKYAALVDSAARVLTCQVPAATRFSYTDSSRIKLADVTIRVNDTNNFLDNPKNVQVEMYKCTELNGIRKTCGECLGSVDLKYGCGWCQSSSSTCQVKSLCPGSANFLSSNKSSCPHLEIREITPINGPTQGNTQLTISGVNLGKSYAQIRDGVKIWLDGAPKAQCVVNETLPHNPFELQCRTAEANKGSGRVKVQISGGEGLEAASVTKFSFYDPKVNRISATRGPVSGGSKIAMVGQHINIGSHRQVLLRMSNGFTQNCELLLSKNYSDNLGEVVFLTPRITRAQNVTLLLTVDAFTANHTYTFSYVNDSKVSWILPSKGILSGGTVVQVEGTSLDIIQQPKMYLRLLIAAKTRRRRAPSSAGNRKPLENLQLTFPCTNITRSSMTCRLPKIPKSWRDPSRTPVNISYGFILDGIQSARDLSARDDFPVFEIHEDPEFEKFQERVISPSSPLKIKGRNLLVVGPDEVVMPMVSVVFTIHGEKLPAADHWPCNVTTIHDTMLYCDVPEVLEASRKYDVTVGYGSLLKVNVGTVSRTASSVLTQTHIIIIGVSTAIFIVIIVVIIAILKCRLSQTDQGMKKLRDKMDNLEMTVAKECKEAFAELQTDMTEMTADIAALHGLPFYEYSQYSMKVLFPAQIDDDHPIMRKLDIQHGKESVESGLRRFSSLVLNKTFLLTFIRTLEQQRQFGMRDRVEIASLVSVVLQPHMEYHTDILKTLLAELIERTMETKKDAPKILLRRTESVAEKMLSNWFAFLLHKFLKECAGEPLYLLYRAIKQHIDKGPVDAVTADARYSLSEDKLLRQSVESRPLTLRFYSPDPHAAQDPQTVKVLDCDTVSQAVDKILDTLYRNAPNTNKPSKDTLTLEWIKPDGERVAMYDEDPAFTKVEADGCKRLVQLQHYKITDNAMVALTSKHLATDPKSSLPKYDTTSSTGNYYSSTGDSLSRANSLNNILDSSPVGAKERRVLRYHLVKPSEADVHQEGDRNKMVSEIYLTRLLATKGTLQTFVDDLFETIFSTSHRGSALPLAIKYMFDFLDDQALLHSIGNPEVIHHWKSNSLPLRFWVNVIKNPDFVFDIHKSNIVDACLSVVAQIFMDSCSLSEHKLGKESPSSKLLYAKDIPKYRKWVERYYSDIKSMPAISDQDMSGILAEESRQHRNEFNNSAALYELYKYVQEYQTEVLNALREDEFARKDRLADQLDYINGLLNNSSRIG